jgi:hypothetical protein
VRTLLIVTAALLLAGPLEAQTGWHVALEAGDLRFSGTSADTSSEGPGSFRPYRPTAAALRFERGGGRLRVGMGLVYASGPVALASPDVTLSVEGTPLTLLELAPALSWRVLRLGSGSLRVSGGPIIDRWSWDVAPTRWRVGGELAAQLEGSLGGSAALVVRAGIAHTASVFDQEDLPPGFALRRTWRRSLTAGIALGR